jgi:hypothetical protein
MKTELIDFSVILNGKEINIVNTQGTIFAEWDCIIEKEETTSWVVVDIKEVYGSFGWLETKDSYKIKKEISFKTDNSWEITPSIKDNTNKLSPYKVKINLDDKKIIVYL